MARTRVSDTKYQSEFGATRPITAAAKMVEIVCKRLAHKNGEHLPMLFWSKDAPLEWQKEFKLQLREANILLKLYDEMAIFAALRINSWVFTLRMKRFKEMVAVEQAKLDRTLAASEAETPQILTPTQPQAPPIGGTPPKPTSTSKSTRAKLRGL